jgi:hypothetical protein
MSHANRKLGVLQHRLQAVEACVNTAKIQPTTKLDVYR